MANEGNSVIKFKNGKEKKWNLVTNYIPAKGEPIVYNPDETHPAPRLKFGNGIDLPRDLPFVDAGSVEGMDSNNIEADRLKHSLTIGSVVFDGSADAKIPVYTGSYSVYPQ